MGMGKELGQLHDPLLDEDVPFGTMLFVSPRRYTDVVAIRQTPHGVTGSVERIYESEDEWARRCGSIKSLGMVM